MWAAEGNSVELTESEFQSLYGIWQPLSPALARDLLDGLRWWVVGGWAIELATGVDRSHDDLDVAIPRTQIVELAAHLSGFDLWLAHEASLTPLSRLPALLDEHEQLWMRRNASSPWLLDVLLQPVEDEHWVFKRDRRIRVPMNEAVLVTDGIPHLAPELVLLHKAHLCRPKDNADLEATLPLLSSTARSWLVDALRAAVPESPWNERLATR
jgi:hypothetical protein